VLELNFAGFARMRAVSSAELAQASGVVTQNKKLLLRRGSLALARTIETRPLFVLRICLSKGHSPEQE